MCDVEYSEARLATLFTQWRRREHAAQTLLDVHLAFLGGLQAYFNTEVRHHDNEKKQAASEAVQAQVQQERAQQKGSDKPGAAGGGGTSHRARSRWLLLKQVAILMKSEPSF